MRKDILDGFWVKNKASITYYNGVVVSFVMLGAGETIVTMWQR